MDRADLKYATMSSEDRQRRLKKRAQHREEYQRKKALQARADAEGVSVESIKPAPGDTMRAKSDIRWSALPPKQIETKLKERARAAIKYEGYKEKKAEADKAGITVKELTAHNPAPIPLGELVKRRADERYKDLPPEELAKKLAIREQNAQNNAKRKKLKETAKKLGVSVESIKPVSKRIAESDATWAALPEKERQQKLAARARSQKHRAAKKAKKAAEKLSEGTETTGTATAVEPAKPKAKKRKLGLSAEYVVDSDEEAQ